MSDMYKKIIIAALGTLCLLSTVHAKVPRVGRYIGTATTRVLYVDPITFQFSAEETITDEVIVRIRRPLIARKARQRESNRFNFLITPATQNTQGQPGNIFLNSAVINLAGSLTKELLLQYWTISNTRQGFDAVLSNNHQDEAANTEQIWASASLVPGRPQLGTYNAPYSLYDGRYGVSWSTRMEAKVGRVRLNLRVLSCGSALGSNLACFITDIAALRR